jgi:hypothetical protein
MSSRVCTALAATTIIAALPAAALAQFLPPPGAQAPVQDRWPEPAKPPQAAPAPAAPGPAAQAAPRGAAAQAQTQPAGEEPLQSAPAPAPVKKRTPPPAPAAATSVTCGGPFAKDTSHLKLAIKYDSRNIAFGQVDGTSGAKIPASILFPNDPKRRLEVVWTNEAAHSGISVIAINGKSQWSAPKGLKLGLSLAALEKANGKPFKLSAVSADGTAGVIDWQDGALNALPGGCKVGMRLAADPKSTPDARSAVSGDKEFLSSDADVRALKPTVMEILIGY